MLRRGPTTSHLDAQAYAEIREDGHPVVILAGRDIVAILKNQGVGTTHAVGQLLRMNYAPKLLGGQA